MTNQLSDKVSYIRGLMEGMKFDTDSDEGRLLGKIVEALGDMAQAIEAVSEAQDELSEFVDNIDEDLSEIEEVLFDDEDDDEDEDDYDDLDDEDDFDEDDEDDEDEDEDDDTDTDIYVECVCPQCKMTFAVLESELSPDALHVCPECGAKVHAVPTYETDHEISVAHLAEDEDE